MKKLVSIAAGLGLALGLAGCGGGSNGPEKAVETFTQAVKDGDYETVCNTIDPKLVKTLEEQSGDRTCAELFKENEDAFAKEIPEDAKVNIQDSEISDDEKTATVTVKNDEGKEEQIELVNVEGEWKITFE